MFDFPSATKVHRRIPKEAFYRNLTLTKVLKEKFVSDVDRIYVEHCFTAENLNLTNDSEIKEILFLSISLKNPDFDGKVIEAIAKSNPHQLAFVLISDDMWQLALYRGKLYRSEWMNDAEISLKLDGFSLDEIWDSFAEQIALYKEKAERTDDLSVDERLARQEEIQKLEKLIEKTEKAAWKEPQPKKQFTLYGRLREYQKLLEGLKNG